MILCKHGQNFDFCSLRNPSPEFVPVWKDMFPDPNNQPDTQEKIADLKARMKKVLVDRAEQIQC